MKSVVMEQTERQADPGQTAQLIEVLRALESSYTNLLGLLRVRKERVRRGDLKGLYDCVRMSAGFFVRFARQIVSVRW